MLQTVPRRTRALLTIGIVGATAFIASCKGMVAPGDMTTSQAVIDIGNMVIQLREENADLQAQIDSLRAAAAYQDTIVRQLAGAAGLAMRPPGSLVP